MYGAAPMSVEKLKRAIEVFGPVMMGGYGQTEAPASISYLPPDEHFATASSRSDERLSSVGRPNPLIARRDPGRCATPILAAGRRPARSACAATS